jgi:hypothetical protein
LGVSLFKQSGTFHIFTSPEVWVGADGNPGKALDGSGCMTAFWVIAGCGDIKGGTNMLVGVGDKNGDTNMLVGFGDKNGDTNG